MNNTSHPVYPRVLPVGDTAFTVEFGDLVDPAVNRQVHSLDAVLAASAIHGIVEAVPSYRSLLVIYDPDAVQPATLQALLLTHAQTGLASELELAGRLVEIPVRYGDDAGPDLEDVAEHCGITTTDVIRLHTGPTYQVAMLGFAPGFAYLLGLPKSLATPRLATPRLSVEPGSVGIAGDQTGVYALSTPGGWRIIGRTDMALFDPTRDDPFALQAGDRVRFVAK